MDRRAFVTTGFAAGAGLSLGAVEAAAQDKPKVRILGISCSPRKGKTTSQAVRVALDAAKAVSPNVEIELVELAGMKFDAAVAAGQPSVFGSEDQFDSIAAKVRDASVAGIIIGTPVYFGCMSALCKAFIDRCIALRKDFALADKVLGVVAVGGNRNGGQELTIDAVQQCLMAQEMIVVGDGRPTAHRGGTVVNSKDDISTDETGVATCKNVGRRVAEVALKVRGAK